MQYPASGDMQNRPPTIVPRGFLIFSSILIALIAIVGIITYNNLETSLALPDDLKLYGDRLTTMAQITSKSPAPADTARLTAERIELFMGTLAPVANGYTYMKHKLDSLNKREGIGKKEKVDFWGSPHFIQQLNRMPLQARRDLVVYLNSHDLSWEEYLWLKEHVVAASGLTRRQFDSTFDTRLRSYFRAEDSASTNMIPIAAVPLFERAEALRGRVIDSSEVALVIPYRSRLLDEGFPSLMGIETRFADESSR